MRIVAETARRHDIHSLHLEGGTALSAYFLGHRESEDLDFFGDPDFHAAGFVGVLSPVLADSGFSLEVVGSPSAWHARALARHSDSGIAVKLDFGASSSFRLAPREVTTETIEVASYRDLCAGKLHAICDRFEVRDFLDLHAILTRPDPSGAIPHEGEFRDRARAVIRDLMESDPGLDAATIGTAVAQGKGRSIAAPFPLRLLRPFDEASIQQTITLVLDECVELAAPHLP
ncbi:nucleotidyl transferase AbiEii/AbiGii toxin family protein [Longimicrobium terrae]|nr:nucleotidyl transferase AbiEii/AbiGii toxin family protein [Longimicrobium terrae]MBB4638981.1 hypothetical protein [Longimicrobium terrae]NNC32329.1 nucleotidyl transferase AbiEii/AbiGii toxin family protein [Longimicrobium terrae]